MAGIIFLVAIVTTSILLVVSPGRPRPFDPNRVPKTRVKK